MNRALIDNWNESVAEDDTVWVIGDFALGKIVETLRVVANLTGRKILVAGNHDRCWSGHGRGAEGWAERYLDAGFAEISQGSKKIKVGTAKVVLCHFPYRGDSHEHDRMINVGVDANRFLPISESAVTDLITAGPMNRLAPTSL